jgi:hypothetical protein
MMGAWRSRNVRTQSWCRHSLDRMVHTRCLAASGDRVGAGMVPEDDAIGGESRHGQRRNRSSRPC